MTREQFTAIVPGKVAEREADRMALYERTAERLSAHIEAYPALSPDHDYLKAKRISPEPGRFQTPRGSMAVPAFDADGKLWSVQIDKDPRFQWDFRIGKNGAIEPNRKPPTISAIIMTPQSQITVHVLRSLFSCPSPRNT